MLRNKSRPPLSMNVLTRSLEKLKRVAKSRPILVSWLKNSSLFRFSAVRPWSSRLEISSILPSIAFSFKLDTLLSSSIKLSPVSLESSFVRLTPSVLPST